MAPRRPLNLGDTPPALHDTLKDVLIMQKKMSKAVSRVENRINDAKICMSDVKTEHRAIKETQKNIEDKLKRLLTLLEEFDQRSQQGTDSVTVASGSGSQAVQRIKLSPEHSDRLAQMAVEQRDDAGPSNTRKRKFEEEVAVNTSASTGISSRRVHKRSRRSLRNQTISSQEVPRIENINDREEAALNGSEGEEKDELESDVDPVPKRSGSPPASPPARLTFTHNDRCSACINKGLPECLVLKEPYLQLEGYVQSVLAGKAEHRPRSSSCINCWQTHAKFCHFPITRDNLGPGFTLSHLAGPFPVPNSAERTSRRGLPRGRRSVKTEAPSISLDM